MGCLTQSYVKRQHSSLKGEEVSRLLNFRSLYFKTLHGGQIFGQAYIVTQQRFAYDQIFLAVGRSLGTIWELSKAIRWTQPPSEGVEMGH